MKNSQSENSLTAHRLIRLKIKRRISFETMLRLMPTHLPVLDEEQTRIMEGQTNAYDILRHRN